MLTVRNKDSYYTLPIVKRMSIFSAKIALIEKNKTKGRCKDIYFDVDFKGFFSVWDLNTNEEAAELMCEMPGREFMDMDLQPIMDLDIAVKQIKMYYEIGMKG